MLANDFGPLALQAIQNEMIEVGHSRGYLNQHIGRVRRVFKWGVSRELVEPRVHHALAAVPDLRRGKTAVKETAPVMPVDDEVVEQTKRHCPQVVADMISCERQGASRRFVATVTMLICRMTSTTR